MKKIWILLLVMIIAPCLPAFTLNWGFAADAAVYSDFAKDGADKASYLDMTLIPAAVLMLKPKVELRPFLAMQIISESDPNNIAVWRADFTQFFLGLGAGLYYHFIQKEIFIFSLGPRLGIAFGFKPSGTSAPAYTTYSDITLALELPVNLDIKLNKNLFLRTGIVIPGLVYSNRSETVGGVKSSTGYFNFVDFQSGFTLYFGFYYML